MHSANQPQQWILQPKGNCARVLLLLLAGLLFCFGGSLLAAGMYMQSKFSFASEIVGSALAAAAAYLCIVSGFLVVFVALLGGWAAHSLSRCGLIAFTAILILLSLLTLTGGLMATLFRASLASGAKESMLYSLRRQFGRQRLVTEAWDEMQIRLRCCGVDTRGWLAFNNSEWDLTVNADARNQRFKIPQWSPLYKFVPESCCTRLLDASTLWPTDTVRSVYQCQYWPYGPPNRLVGGFNDALNYKGCFDAVAELLSAQTGLLAWLAFSVFVFMAAGVVCAVLLLSNLPPHLASLRADAARHCRRQYAYLHQQK